MAKGTFKISEGGSTYIPDELRDDGFVGDVPYLANAATVTMMRPGVSLDQVEKSLRIILKDVALRKDMENNNGLE